MNQEKANHITFWLKKQRRYFANGVPCAKRIRQMDLRLVRSIGLLNRVVKTYEIKSNKFVYFDN